MFPEFDDGEELAASGVLHDVAIQRLIHANNILASRPFSDTQIQPASLDLRLGATAYQVEASFLPTRSTTVMEETEHLLLQTLALAAPTLLEVGSIYVIPLIEGVRLPRNISGKANSKSTTGRLDVFTRLLADNTDEFDRVPPGHSGRLFIEVAPRTFGVIVHEGTTLNQVRFLRGTTAQSDNRLNTLHQANALLFADDNNPADALISNGLWISIDLQGTRLSMANSKSPPGGLFLHRSTSRSWARARLAHAKGVAAGDDRDGVVE